MSTTSVNREPFGVTSSGQHVDRYTLQNDKGMTVRLITYGAIVTELHVPDRNGKNEDVVLGFDNLRQYETETAYFGCLIGRVAFRTAGAKFELDGKTYTYHIRIIGPLASGRKRGPSPVASQTLKLHASRTGPR